MSIEDVQVFVFANSEACMDSKPHCKTISTNINKLTRGDQ